MRRILTGIGVLACATLIGSGVTYAAVHRSGNHTDPLTIDVIGHAKITTTPSVLETNIGVTATADTTGTASKLLTDNLQKVMDSLKGNGVKPEDIKTGSISTGGMTIPYAPCNYCDPTNQTDSMPRYVPQNSATATLTVRLHDLSSIGKTLSDVLALDNNANDKVQITLTTASFAVDNPDKYTQQAQAAATANGREQAASMAQAANMKLGKLLTITVQSKPNIVPMQVYNGANSPTAVDDQKAVSSIPVTPGQTDIEASVALTYQLK